MFHIYIIVYMINYSCALRQFIAVIKSFNMFQILEYTDFLINIIISFHELRDDKYPADITPVTEDDIQVKAHKIILSSISIMSILHVLTIYGIQDQPCEQLYIHFSYSHTQPLHIITVWGIYDYPVYHLYIHTGYFPRCDAVCDI